MVDAAAWRILAAVGAVAEDIGLRDRGAASGLEAGKGARVRAEVLAVGAGKRDADAFVAAVECLARAEAARFDDRLEVARFSGSGRLVEVLLPVPAEGAFLEGCGCSRYLARLSMSRGSLARALRIVSWS